MPAHRIYFHLTWSTLARRPMIDAPTRAFLHEYFRKIALQERATIVSLGFLQTHAHLLVRTGGNLLGLRWNREYSVTSVSPKFVPQAMAYIEGQDGRHPSEAIPR